MYEAVARGDFFSDPYSLAAIVANLLRVPVREVVGIVMAIVRGIHFLAESPNPHYSPYDIGGGIAWVRGRLTALSEVTVKTA